MDKRKILIVDDEERMRRLVKDYLVKNNFDVVEAQDGLEAVDLFYQDSSISLIICDVMMPKMDGWQVCREIRESSNVPFIMLTARSEEQDELLGFELGVDEYITKPFSPKILAARVEAILRRSNVQAGDDIVEFDGIRLDRRAHSVLVDGNAIELSLKEYDLLDYFITNKGLALSREKILSNVWQYDYEGYDRTIDTHVKKLRSKLGAKGDHVKTIWGMGYKFE